ncbi:MAG: hypothetical protein MHM6MM_000814 [Cercozoa sp. M6MM]
MAPPRSLPCTPSTSLATGLSHLNVDTPHNSPPSVVRSVSRHLPKEPSRERSVPPSPSKRAHASCDDSASQLTSAGDANSLRGDQTAAEDDSFSVAPRVRHFSSFDGSNSRQMSAPARRLSLFDETPASEPEHLEHASLPPMTRLRRDASVVDTADTRLGKRTSRVRSRRVVAPRSAPHKFRSLSANDFRSTLPHTATGDLDGLEGCMGESKELESPDDVKLPARKRHCSMSGNSFSFMRLRPASAPTRSRQQEQDPRAPPEPMGLKPPVPPMRSGKKKKKPLRIVPRQLPRVTEETLAQSPNACVGSPKRRSRRQLSNRGSLDLGQLDDVDRISWDNVIRSAPVSPQLRVPEQEQALSQQGSPAEVDTISQKPAAGVLEPHDDLPQSLLSPLMFPALSSGTAADTSLVREQQQCELAVPPASLKSATQGSKQLLCSSSSLSSLLNSSDLDRSGALLSHRSRERQVHELPQHLPQHAQSQPTLSSPSQPHHLHHSHPQQSQHSQHSQQQSHTQAHLQSQPQPPLVPLQCDDSNSSSGSSMQQQTRSVRRRQAKLPSGNLDVPRRRKIRVRTLQCADGASTLRPLSSSHSSHGGATFFTPLPETSDQSDGPNASLAADIASVADTSVAAFAHMRLCEDLCSSLSQTLLSASVSGSGNVSGCVSARPLDPDNIISQVKPGELARRSTSVPQLPASQMPWPDLETRARYLVEPTAERSLLETDAEVTRVQDLLGAWRENAITYISDVVLPRLLLPEEDETRLRKRTGFDSVIVLDCRFNFEYLGGHIRSALNLTSPLQVENLLFSQLSVDGSGVLDTPLVDRCGGPTRTCVVLHCEFSSERAPEMWRFVRRVDRALNQHYAAVKGNSRSPEESLCYPHLYVLRGGYAQFQRRHLMRYPALFVRHDVDPHPVLFGTRSAEQYADVPLPHASSIQRVGCSQLVHEMCVLRHILQQTEEDAPLEENPDAQNFNEDDQALDELVQRGAIRVLQRLDLTRLVDAINLEENHLEGETRVDHQILLNAECGLEYMCELTDVCVIGAVLLAQARRSRVSPVLLYRGVRRRAMYRTMFDTRFQQTNAMKAELKAQHNWLKQSGLPCVNWSDSDENTQPNANANNNNNNNNNDGCGGNTKILGSMRTEKYVFADDLDLSEQNISLPSVSVLSLATAEPSK